MDKGPVKGSASALRNSAYVSARRLNAPAQSLDKVTEYRLSDSQIRFLYSTVTSLNGNQVHDAIMGGKLCFVCDNLFKVGS